MSSIPHFTLQTCKDVLHNIGSHSFAKVLSASIFCTYAHAFNDGKVFIPIFSLVLLDALTGCMKAIVEKDFKGSRAFFRSAQKFLVYLIMILVAGILDTEFPGQYASITMKSFLMITEAISILENISKLGWPIPSKLLKFLKLFDNDDK